MNTIKRITVICFAVLVLAANLPLCASAVDPVSAATMANAMAQAITAYGASQGVSMTFDVTDTAGIGEGVHELWDQFKEEVNDPNTPTYDSLAVTMWSNLYSKIGNNLGINISASEMPYIDAFWNWILAGPAEMTKVDNQYYEWTINQNNTVDPITVITIGPIPNQPFPYIDNNATDSYKYNNSPLIYEFSYVDENNITKVSTTHLYNTSVQGQVYAFMVGLQMYCCSTINAPYRTITYVTVSNSYNSPSSVQLRYTDPDTGLRYYNNQLGSGTGTYYIPSFSTSAEGFAYIKSIIDGDTVGSSLSVRPYIGDTTPQDIYIPDNDDVNYTPVDVAVPLDIPWDNTLFGDGDGVLTDAQSEAAAHAADSAITDSLEKTLTIADTENPDLPAQNEVYIPLLPVNLPSFNFSLSGIWHYVVSWVQSLGAWLSLMFKTWAILPSAITIPVYATAVIVIVLGVYKRFFM